MERTGTKVIPLEDCPIADPGIRHALQERRILIPPDRDRWTVYSRGETFLSEAGTNHGKIQILDREIFVEAGAFFQSNGTVLEYLIKDILDFTLKADPDRPAADLYGGVGTFGAFLQDYFPHLSIVEENPAAAPFIHKNVPAAKVVSGTVDQWLNNAPDLGFAVADPPRTGLSALTRSVLAKSGPPFLVYVSCNCATLARDLRVFLDSGYAIHRILVYDFYPQTAHIESAVFLEKGFVR
ncbi:hypothetical protein FACS1894164_13870 [Spirochaetia bacterium]|nr:hypothetical protein FACS1894164_13870 [Spirochaetia bacterium]